MSKEIIIADRTCYGYWDKGTFKQNCTYDSDSTGIGPISIILGFIIIIILIFKKNSSNNFSKVSSKSLEEYVLWHRNNKDASASIGNSYKKGNFLIVKDKFGNVLDEVEPRVIKYRLTGDVGDLDDLLDEYIEFYNQKNKKKADIMNSKKKGDDFILCDLFNKVIKKINVDDCFNELTHGKFVKD